METEEMIAQKLAAPQAPVIKEHPAKQLNGTPMLLAMQRLGREVFGGTSRPKAVARRRARNKAARKTRQAARRG